MREWLHNLVFPPAHDEMLARKEYLLNVTIIAIGVLFALDLAGNAGLIARGVEQALPAAALSGGGILLCALAYWLGRRGRLVPAGYVLALTVWADVTVTVALSAWRDAAVAGYVLSVVVATVLAGWPGGLALCVLGIVSYGVAMRSLPSAMSGIALWRGGYTLGSVLIVVWIVVHLFVRRTLRLATRKRDEAERYAAELLRYERERQGLVAQLEAERREQQALADMLHRVSVPVLPLLDGLIVVPISGQLDPQRVDRLLDDLLAGIHTYGADHVLLDITGLLDVDDRVALGLLRAIQGAQLVGSDCALVGVQPQIAQQMVALGIDLAQVRSYSTLRDGVAAIRGPA
jgi:anti-anti-sigma regulatory factor